MKMEDYLKGYYATLSAVDESLGRVLAYLRDNGLEKDTMIVLTSDNGFLIGDHGLIDKRNAYEGSVRIPMVVYAPGLVPAGVTSPGRVRNLDFAPTFLDVAHVAQPPQFEGSRRPRRVSRGLARRTQPAGPVQRHSPGQRSQAEGRAGREVPASRATHSQTIEAVGRTTGRRGSPIGLCFRRRRRRPAPRRQSPL